MDPQSAGAVLMVRPASFGFNPQTAASNAFQQGSIVAQDPKRAALREFDAVVATLSAQGIEVLVAADTEAPAKPDAIFPNNWVSFHRDGTVALYPMLAVNRRWERRDEIIGQIVTQGRFRVQRTIDLTHREAEGKYLEGTGSMVLDRVARVAYACVSPRTDLDVLGEFAQTLDYDLVTFDAVDGQGRAVYHTNVLMAIGTGYAVLCGECIDDPTRRAAVISMLEASGHRVIDIDRAQMLRFAGNMLELTTSAGTRLLVLSDTALGCLRPEQRRTLEAHARLVPVSIPVIEHHGGGGIRCMLAEIHLPKRAVS